MRGVASSRAWFRAVVIPFALASVACEKPQAPASATPTSPASIPAPTPVPAPSPAVPAPAPTPSSSTLGESEAKTAVEGCLASSSGMPERAAPTTRALPGAPVEIVPGAKPKVVHHLTHACCLSSRTRVERAAASLAIIEELSGTPCRCQCASTLTTELNLPPGKYELTVHTLQSGARTEVFRGPLEIGAAASSPAASASSPPRLPRSIQVPAAAH